MLVKEKTTAAVRATKDIKTTDFFSVDRLCGLVVRIPGFDSRRYKIFLVTVGLELVHSDS
jgi:hypothetical protein